MKLIENNNEELNKLQSNIKSENRTQLELN